MSLRDCSVVVFCDDDGKPAKVSIQSPDVSERLIVELGRTHARVKYVTLDYYETTRLAYEEDEE